MANDRPKPLTYEFPVRPGLTVLIQLPRDMSATEAERVARFVESLAQGGTDGE